MSEKLDIKSKFAIGTAVVAFVVGFGLTIAGFLLPPKGEVHDSERDPSLLEASFA